MTTTGLKIAGAGVLTLLAGSVFIGVRSSRRDKHASMFLKLLREKVIASSLGDLENTAFNPNYLAVLKKEVSGVIPTLSNSKAKQLAKNIYQAFSWYNDDEDAIYGVFDQLKSKVKVAQVAAAYLSQYKTGMLKQLLDKLSNDEFKKIKTQVKNLKDY